MPTLPENITNDMIRLLVWLVSDGTMVDGRKYDGPDSVKRRVQFKLSLPQKIERLQALLTKMNMPFTLKPATMSGINKLQPYYIRIYGDSGRMLFDLLEGVKQYPEWFAELDSRQCLIVLETLTHTDGGWAYRKVRWTTTSDNDADVIGRLCRKHGLDVHDVTHLNRSGFANSKPQHHVRIGFGEDGPKVRRKVDGEWRHSVWESRLAA